MKPRLLDLFCKAGGCTKGYQNAGFYVIGVDIEPQPNYCGDEFIQADALRVLPWWVDDIDAMHASPPCPRYSSITAVTGNQEDHPDLIGPVRELLKATGLPYVIENVAGARREMQSPYTLCGSTLCPSIIEDGVTYFIRRHRLFETNFPMMVPPCTCSPHKGTTLGIYGGGTRQDTRKEANPGGGNTSKANKAQAAALMQIDWMTRTEMCQAIPPAYIEHIGGYLMAELEAKAVAA